MSRGIIQEIQIPAGFELDREILGGLGSGWLCSYRSKRHKEVEIALFYRGASISAEAASSFRNLLNRDEQLIFDHSTASEASRKSAEDLGPALGNLKDNQITNQRVGTFGPKFFLERIEIITLNNRKVLNATGYFQDINGDPENHYQGIFIDANPEDNKRCRIEELVYQASSQDLLKKYAPDFDATLNSITWAPQSKDLQPNKSLELFKLKF